MSDGVRPGGPRPGGPAQPDPRPPKSARLERIRRLAASPLVMDAPPFTSAQRDQIATAFRVTQTTKVSGRRTAANRSVGLAA